MFSTATDSRAARLAQRAIDVLTTDEAIAFYIEVLEITRAAGDGLRRFSESIALDILHGVAYFLTLAVWGAAELWAYVATEMPVLIADARFALVEAVAASQSEPPALPWVAEAGFSAEFLAQSSENLEIEWPECSSDSVWITGMMPSA